MPVESIMLPAEKLTLPSDSTRTASSCRRRMDPSLDCWNHPLAGAGWIQAWIVGTIEIDYRNEANGAMGGFGSLRRPCPGFSSAVRGSQESDGHRTGPEEA